MATCELAAVHEQPLELHQDAADDLIFKFYDDCGDEAQIGPNDHVVFLLRDSNGVEYLRIDSEGATSEGSIIGIADRGTAGSVPAEVKVTIAQGDAGYLQSSTWEIRTKDDQDQERVVAHGRVDLFP